MFFNPQTEWKTTAVSQQQHHESAAGADGRFAFSLETTWSSSHHINCRCLASASVHQNAAFSQVHQRRRSCSRCCSSQLLSAVWAQVSLSTQQTLLVKTASYGPFLSPQRWLPWPQSWFRMISVWPGHRANRSPSAVGARSSAVAVMCTGTRRKTMTDSEWFFILICALVKSVVTTTILSKTISRPQRTRIAVSWR